MYYAYVIESVKKPGTYYRGHATDVAQRLHHHNEGKCDATRALRPWRMKCYMSRFPIFRPDGSL